MTGSSALLVRGCNAVLMVAALVVTFVVVDNRLRPRVPELPATDALGVVNLLDTSEFGATPWTVVLVVNSTCPFCTDSMSFYSDLAHLRSSSGSPLVRLVAVSTEEEAVTADYFTVNGVVIGSTVSSTQSIVSGALTPTLIIVDRERNVVGSFVGRLSQRAEAEVLNIIGAAA